ncbi:MAG: hypothetical protein AAGI66_07705 [Cyanobacteria bacterium P01_H01_bin.74]
MASYIPFGFKPTNTIPGQPSVSTGLLSYLPGGALPKALMGLTGVTALYFMGKNVLTPPGTDTYENSSTTSDNTSVKPESDVEQSEKANSNLNPAETDQSQTGWGRVAAIGTSLVATLGGGFYFREKLAAMAPKVFSSAAAVAAKQPTKSIWQKVGGSALNVAGSAARHTASFGLHCGKVGAFVTLLIGAHAAYNQFSPSEEKESKKADQNNGLKSPQPDGQSHQAGTCNSNATILTLEKIKAQLCNRMQLYYRSAEKFLTLLNSKVKTDALTNYKDKLMEFKNICNQKLKQRGISSLESAKNPDFSKLPDQDLELLRRKFDELEKLELKLDLVIKNELNQIKSKQAKEQ